jgi:septation ring formation regulator EzrA
MQLHSDIKTPCLSYMQLDNPTAAKGDTLEYSTLTYQIKVWANKLNEIQDNAIKVDNKMRGLGFKRLNSRELYDKNSTMIQKVMTYEIFVKEDL